MENGVYEKLKIHAERTTLTHRILANHGTLSPGKSVPSFYVLPRQSTAHRIKTSYHGFDGKRTNYSAENLKTVVCKYVSPGFSSVVGKLGWLGESG